MPVANFPTEIRYGLAKGVAGDPATVRQSVFTDRNYVAGDAGVTVGNFVWADPDNPTPDEYWGSGVLKALSTGTADVQPVALVRRNLSYYMYNVLDGGTLVVPENAPLNGVVRGDYYVVSSTVATRGQAVFANLAGGGIQTGPAGTPIGGTVETSWVVTEGGPIGEVIVISNWEK